MTEKKKKYPLPNLGATLDPNQAFWRDQSPSLHMCTPVHTHCMFRALNMAS